MEENGLKDVCKSGSCAKILEQSVFEETDFAFIDEVNENRE